MRWPIRDPARGSGGSNGTIRHRCQNVNEPRRFIDEITCPGEMRPRFQGLPLLRGKRCQRVTKADFDPPDSSHWRGVRNSRSTRFIGFSPMKWLPFESIDAKKKEKGKKKEKTFIGQRLTDFFLRSRRQRIGKEIETRRMRDKRVENSNFSREKLTRSNLRGRSVDAYQSG